MTYNVAIERFPVFERFTERNRQVVVLAQDAARKLKHNYIGTEHLLLGLLREKEGLGARVLESFDITAEEVEQAISKIVGQGDEATSGQIPFTPRAKKVLELALREALSLGHNYIGTEHTLLGLVRENEGVAARILLDFDLDAETIRNEVLRMLRAKSEDSTFKGKATRAWNKVPQDVGANVAGAKQNSENEMASSAAGVQLIVDQLMILNQTLEAMRIDLRDGRRKEEAGESEA